MTDDTTTMPTPIRPAARKAGLDVRFVTRMSGELRRAVASAARRDGLTAGSWARRALMEKIGITSPADARSGRPIRRPEEETVALSAAIRDLAAAATALRQGDPAAARESLDRARGLLVPLVLQRHER